MRLVRSPRSHRLVRETVLNARNNAFGRYAYDDDDEWQPNKVARVQHQFEGRGGPGAGDQGELKAVGGEHDESVAVQPPFEEVVASVAVPCAGEVWLRDGLRRRLHEEEPTQAATGHDRGSVRAAPEAAEGRQSGQRGGETGQARAVAETKILLRVRRGVQSGPAVLHGQLGRFLRPFLRSSVRCVYVG